MKRLLNAIGIAAVLWFVMFSPWTKPYVNFWYVMLISAGLLTTLALFWGNFREAVFAFRIKDLIIAILSAVLLWFVFYAGDAISRMLFSFARPEVDSVYAMRDGQNSRFLALALMLWIGPAEEVFWRGYVQRSLEGRFGKWIALLIATAIYAAVHLWSFNFMLIMAALICGAFWGALYLYNRNLVTVILSHALWDVGIFILFPIM